MNQKARLIPGGSWREAALPYSMPRAMLQLLHSEGHAGQPFPCIAGFPHVHHWTIMCFFATLPPHQVMENWAVFLTWIPGTYILPVSFSPRFFNSSSDLVTMKKICLRESHLPQKLFEVLFNQFHPSSPFFTCQLQVLYIIYMGNLYRKSKEKVWLKARNVLG